MRSAATLRNGLYFRSGFCEVPYNLVRLPKLIRGKA